MEEGGPYEDTRNATLSVDLNLSAKCVTHIIYPVNTINTEALLHSSAVVGQYSPVHGSGTHLKGLLLSCQVHTSIEPPPTLVWFW